MKQIDRRLRRDFAGLVAAQDVPAAPMADWLAAPGAAAGVIELAACWPEDLRLKAPTGLVSVAATLAIAGSLALLQVSGWVNPIDLGSARLLADQSVQGGLESAWHFAQTGSLQLPKSPLLEKS